MRGDRQRSRPLLDDVGAARDAAVVATTSPRRCLLLHARRAADSGLLRPTRPVVVLPATRPSLVSGCRCCFARQRLLTCCRAAAVASAVYSHPRPRAVRRRKQYRSCHVHLHSLGVACVPRWTILCCGTLESSFLFVPGVQVCVALGGRVVRTLDLPSIRREFESWPLRYRVQPWASC